MENLANPVTLAALLSITVLVALYTFFVPRNTGDRKVVFARGGTQGPLLHFAAIMGQELYLTVPKGFLQANSKKNSRLESLLMRSGNPWGVTPDEFSIIRAASAFGGIVVGVVIWLVVALFVPNVPLWAPLWLTPVILGLLGYWAPVSTYQEHAKKRDLEFKRKLPDALGLIIVSLSGGLTLSSAIRASAPNMEEGVLKQEFEEMLRNIDSGRTVDEALAIFAKRAPNSGVQAFVQALRQASELNVPMVEVLQDRAEASREEFNNMVKGKIASLNSRMMIVITPTFLFALLIVLIAPAVVSIGAGL